ncbi:MAG: endonuclease/exonuclease/phosphatase family protein [Thermoguttaceae bacterium]|nr:endonuclease/exonuclease/phosphatase family protein [Thermoguttaceae bacterium]MBQ6618989.1 endonuclease/exonuclease/phosphatase family protein [Thermoguttaceae bacterium]
MTRRIFFAAAAVLAAGILSLCAAVRADDGGTFRVMSYNIKCAGSAEDNNWSVRLPLVVDQIKEVDPLLFGLQEPTAFQMDGIAAALPEYDFVGVARDDGKRKGEFSPVFYKKDGFELLDSGTFWLSETPEVPGSRGWDAACNRVVSWAKLRCKKSGKTLVFADTHFDHVSDQARQNSARLVLERMYPITEKWSLPFFITGDFNCNASSKGYKTLTAGTDEIPALIDSAKIAKETISDVQRTFNNWGKVPADKKSAYIDFIFVDGKVEVDKFVICPDTREEVYPSDHNAIWAEVRIVE